MPKEALYKIFRHEQCDRPAWVPFAGIHAGKLKDYNAIEVLQDADKLLDSLLEVNKLYQPDGLPIVFDLQVEAEALGCELQWAENSPPTVISHPFGDSDEIPGDDKIPTINDGRITLIMEVTKRTKVAIGEQTALYGLVCGPFTLASHLRGSNIFLDMYDKPDYVKELLEFCRKVAMAMADYYHQAGAEVIAYVDPLVSQISEDHFREFLTEPFSKLFAATRALPCYSAFFVCGDATRNVTAMCETGPDSISIDENINIAEAKKITDKYGIAIWGNIQLTVTMLHGSQNANMKAVVDIIEACGIDNLIVAPGCDLPYDTPIENVIAASQAVLRTAEVKEMIAGFDASLDFSDIEIELPDYSKLDKPLVEIFTLDSASCAACGYMMNAVIDVAKVIGTEFDYVEYKFTEKANILRCQKVGVKNLPSLYINGQLVWSSIIPSSKQLIEAIKAAQLCQ